MVKSAIMDTFRTQTRVLGIMNEKPSEVEDLRKNKVLKLSEDAGMNLVYDTLLVKIHCVTYSKTALCALHGVNE